LDPILVIGIYYSFIIFLFFFSQRRIGFAYQEKIVLFDVLCPVSLCFDLLVCFFFALEKSKKKKQENTKNRNKKGSERSLFRKEKGEAFFLSFCLCDQ
jgi:hypothetical protein